MSHYGQRALPISELDFNVRRLIYKQRHRKITIRRNSKWAVAMKEQHGSK
jgi:hypothetical protein